MGGDLNFLPLSPYVELVVGAQSLTFGVMFPKYLLPIDGSSTGNYNEDEKLEDPN